MSGVEAPTGIGPTLGPASSRDFDSGQRDLNRVVRGFRSGLPEGQTRWRRIAATAFHQQTVEIPTPERQSLNPHRPTRQSRRSIRSFDGGVTTTGEPRGFQSDAAVVGWRPIEGSDDPRRTLRRAEGSPSSRRRVGSRRKLENRRDGGRTRATVRDLAERRSRRTAHDSSEQRERTTTAPAGGATIGLRSRGDPPRLRRRDRAGDRRRANVRPF